MTITIIFNTAPHLSPAEVKNNTNKMKQALRLGAQGAIVWASGEYGVTGVLDENEKEEWRLRCRDNPLDYRLEETKVIL